MLSGTIKENLRVSPAYHTLSECLGCRKRAPDVVSNYQRTHEAKERAVLKERQASLYVETAFFSFEEQIINN